MQQTEITPNLIQLTRMRSVNAYLVREDDGLTLVDTTFSGAAKDLAAAADAAGTPIRRIALTHAHTDHIGSLDALKEQLGGDVEVLIPGIDVRVLRGERTYEGKKVKGGWPKVRTDPDVELSGGERVGSLEVVPTPGHTPGHVSFLDVRDRALIAGDAMATIGGLNVPSHPGWPLPLVYFATWDRTKAVESARALRALDPTVVVVGHGPALRDPGPALDREIVRASESVG